MKLFNKIFRQKAILKIEDENLPSFWEDDYCQIEIVSRNMGFGALKTEAS